MAHSTSISGNSIDRFFATLGILKIVSEADDFASWLSEYHGIRKGQKNIFLGYRLMLDTCARCLVDSIIYDTSGWVSDDRIFDRALPREKTLADIPNSCDRVVFIKNLWNLTKGVRESKNWEEIKTHLKDLRVSFSVFDEIYDLHMTSTRGDISKEGALKFLMIFYTLIFLNDARYGMPWGYELPPILNPNESGSFLEAAYDGYMYTLQYLWFRLIGSIRFEKSCVKDLHKAEEIYHDRAKEDAENKFNLPPREDGLKRIKWFALDGFFTVISKEMIEPLEKTHEFHFVIDNFLTIERPFGNKFADVFLKKSNLKDPSYLSGKDQASIMKRLDYHMLWYDVNILEADRAIFTGVQTFTSMLIGRVETYKREGIDQKICVRVFKHPVPVGHNYSYGILVSTHSDSDNSGWLVFFDCATDYSGFGGSEYRKAKEIINKYIKRGAIEVQEIDVEMETFMKYLTKRSVSRFERYILEDQIRGYLSELKGAFLEYLFYDWLTETCGDKFSRVMCDCHVNGEQIDVLTEVKEKNRMHFYECKFDLHGDDDIIRQIEIKKKVLQRANPGKKIVPYLVVFSEVETDRSLRFTSEGIVVMPFFAQKIKEWRKYTGESMRRIDRIMSHLFYFGSPKGRPDDD